MEGEETAQDPEDSTLPAAGNDKGRPPMSLMCLGAPSLSQLSACLA